MSKRSAGILLYKTTDKELEIFLVHPGGPYFKNKDSGVWTIPKGEIEDNEVPLAAAVREFKEETGQPLTGTFIELKPVKQNSGKFVYAWALEGDIDHRNLKSNSFTIEWPPRSGKMQEFPEVDRGEWFTVIRAREKIIEAQIPLISQLMQILGKS